MTRLALTPVPLLVGILLAAPGLGDDAVESRREKLLGQMRSLAEETNVKFAEGDRQPELVTNPVFRYDDQARRFLDATIWAWTDQGRPVAFEKIEARLDQATSRPQWGYCFTSLSEDKLSVEWSPNRQFRSTAPGITWHPVPDASAPAIRSAARKRQAREIARGFAGRIVIDPKTNRSAEMRLMPTAILEYDDGEANLVQGAVFGFAVYGTNPDVLVLLEVRSLDGKLQWHYAPARMTTGGITLTYRGEPAWEAEFVQPRSGPYATWTFFATPRTPLPGEETP
jgi:hypothetical protein